jgi:hypothetical protein
MTFRIIVGHRRRLRAEPDNDGDSLAQIFVGEANGVANEEFLVVLAMTVMKAGELGRSQQCQG